MTPGTDWGSGEVNNYDADVSRTFVVTNNGNSSITLSSWTPTLTGDITITGVDTGTPFVLDTHTSIDPGITFDTGAAGDAAVSFLVICHAIGAVEITIVN